MRWFDSSLFQVARPRGSGLAVRGALMLTLLVSVACATPPQATPVAPPTAQKAAPGGEGGGPGLRRPRRGKSGSSSGKKPLLRSQRRAPWRKRRYSYC